VADPTDELTPPDPVAPPREPELDERKTRILCAIIAEYVSCAEPIGSKRVVEIAALDVSAATVRNEMSALEELGFINQPHTSAGRVPTDKGYRFFVEQLKIQSQGVVEPRVEVAELVGEGVDLEDVLRKTTRVLSQLTHLVSLVVAPRVDQTRLKLVELVALSPQAVLVVMVTDTGRVEKRLVELRQPVLEIDVDRVRRALNDRAREERVRDLDGVLREVTDEAPNELRELLAGVAGALTQLEQPATENIYVGGAASLAGESAMPREDLSRILELLEERVTLARVMAEMSDDEPVVKIGEEHEVEGLQTTALVARRYRSVNAGSVGVLGPTRMDYAAVLSTVKAVADHLQETLRHADGTD